MTRLIGISTASVLFVLSLLHVYWAAGGAWGSGVTIPKEDGKQIGRASCRERVYVLV